MTAQRSYQKLSLRFDIKAFGAGFSHGEDEKGMLETVGLLQGLIDAEVAAGIDPSRIILGGFSQGAAMTLLTGLTTPTKLGGLVVLSGWLPMKEKIKSASLYDLSSTSSIDKM